MASVVVFVIILIVTILVVIAVPLGTSASTFFGIGCLAGILTIPFMIAFVIFLGGHRNITTKQNVEDKNPIPEVIGIASNTYEPSQVRSNDKVVPPPTATGPCHSTSHSSQQRKVSTCSDYTESHYYTEIDEYYINKRKAKQELKFQKRCQHPEVHGYEKMSGNSNQMDSSSETYDYVYNIRPQK